ncbi:MAG: class I SAM-dependent methyltransferase [Planctomycetota bacterium]
MSMDVQTATSVGIHAGFKLPHWNPQLEMLECISCGKQGVTAFIDESRRPLATIWWPQSEAEAVAMQRLPHSFVRCVSCGHIFNKSFTYDDVPYSRKANLMFNQGVLWQGHLRKIVRRLSDAVSESPTVVEIGCGDGSLLRAMDSQLTGANLIGFDPNNKHHRSANIEFRGELFLPQRHLNELKPDLIVCRHVLEHLQQPMRFLEQIAVVTAISDRSIQLYVEVPCVDRAVKTTRLSDYYYEHNSHFTTQSFRAMLDRIGATTTWLDRFYDDEVLGALFTLAPQPHLAEMSRVTERHRLNALHTVRKIREQLNFIAQANLRVAIWGGTGKAAAFMSLYGMDRARFPLVVDSDRDKCDTFVPGTGQRIRPAEVLVREPADVVVIPMSWRARDIVHEMRKKQIQCEHILIEHDQRLVDFHRDEHPY